MSDSRRPLLALFAALLLPSAARAQSAPTLDGAVAPALAQTREAVAGQKSLSRNAVVAQADAGSQTSEPSDEDLRQTLRGIVLRACAGGEIAAEELDALPAPSDPGFAEGRLPEGLRYGTCAAMMYVRLGRKLGDGERLALSDVATSAQIEAHPANGGYHEIPAIAAPAPAPVAPAPAPAPAAPQAAPGPNGAGAPAPSAGDAEAVARRSLERQNRELGKYDGIVRRSSGDRRRDRDRDRRP